MFSSLFILKQQVKVCRVAQKTIWLDGDLNVWDVCRCVRYSVCVSLYHAHPAAAVISSCLLYVAGVLTCYRPECSLQPPKCTSVGLFVDVVLSCSTINLWYNISFLLGGGLPVWWVAAWFSAPVFSNVPEVKRTHEHLCSRHRLSRGCLMGPVSTSRTHRKKPISK